MKTHIPSCLSDTELVAEVKRLTQCERQAKVSLISHLAELDARRLYLGAGFSSLFSYCTEVLRLSEREAEELLARHFPRPAVRFTASAKTCAKLRLAQDLLRHALSPPQRLRSGVVLWRERALRRRGSRQRGGP